MNYGLIVAAGKSERVGKNVDKAFLTLGTQPVLAYSLTAFEQCPDIDGVVLVVRRDRLDGAAGMAHMFGCSKVQRIVAGGSKRQDSVRNGLKQLGDDARIVAVHDGARPCVTSALISETIKVAKRYGTAVAASRMTDTVKYVERGATVSKTVNRDKLWAVQTPQTFKIDVLRKAFEVVTKKRLTVTDEAAAVEAAGGKVRLVSSTAPNVKITTADDLAVAAALMKI